MSLTTHPYLLAHTAHPHLLHYLFLCCNIVINVVEFIYQELIDQVIRIILLKKLNANSNSC